MNIKTLTTIIAAAIIALGCSEDGQQERQIILGADISWTTKMEDMGCKFYSTDLKEKECTALMKEIGMNAIRLRVWVNPADGYSGKADVLKMARRAKANGMKLMIDFHYSDSWADPGKQ
ncbi:MAG: glycosyl hydrolase 53 family protein, partial [Candidatus Cryptobacteroides sp.]